MKVRAITVDFWNTLFDSSNGFKRNAVRQHVFAEEIAKLDVKINQEDFQKAVSASWEYFNSIWMQEQRTPETIETIGFLWNHLNLPDKPDSVRRLAKVFAESILDYPPMLMPGAHDSLTELKSRGIKIGLISDTGFTPGTILRKVMENAGVLNLFDAFSFSDETGVSKPNHKAYLTILEQFNVAPAEAVHIGDIEKTDIAGAVAVGMHAIRFSGDETGVLNKDNPRITRGNAEIHHWSSFVEAIESIK
ncbi:MAG: HAD family hydrolase [Candidatus Kapaibacterium sp.]